ncbi:MAG TPA: permease [Chthoniobacter sp.]|nr:permease [Chthoniobacter sp.]
MFADFAKTFLSILFEGIPFLLLGSLISGFVDVFVSSERIAKLLPKNETISILVCGWLGLIFPMCECGSVVVIRRFIKKGLPLSSAVTYMLSTPIVSPIVALSTFAAFKNQQAWEMTILRLFFGFAISVAVGFIVQRLSATSLVNPGVLAEPAGRRRAGLSVTAAPTTGTVDFSGAVQAAGPRQKLLLATQSATADFLDVTFFLILGAVVAAGFKTVINQSLILPFATNPPVAIAALMTLRSLLSICSTTDAFIIATFRTFPFAAKLAALVFGPLFDFKLFWLYSLLFKKRVVTLFAIGLFIVVFLVSWRIAAFF